MRESKLRRALRLSPPEAARVAEAWIGLAFARVLFLLLPFPKAVARFGLSLRQGHSDPRRIPSEGPPLEVRNAILRATGIAPFRAVCLQQAFAAVWMLRRRGFSVEVHFGVAKDGNQLLTAHAWSTCRNTIVTGEAAMPGQTRIAVFGC